MKYYLHDSNSFNDERITELYIKFGYEGLGLFYTILEKFAAQEKPVKTIVLKKQLDVGKRLEKCWEFLEEIGLIQSENGESFNIRILNFAGKYKIKNQKNAERVSEWRNNQQVIKNVTHYEQDSNANKVNKSKVKESKVNRLFIKPTINEFLEYGISQGADEQTINKIYQSYDVADWHDAQGKKIKNWKQKLINRLQYNNFKKPVQPKDKLEQYQDWFEDTKNYLNARNNTSEADNEIKRLSL